MQKLINELNEASKLYYNGKESPLSDKEFDIKLKELKRLEQEQKIIYSNSPTINVGAPVLTELNKIQIKDKPMLSLDKVHSAQEIINFSDGYDLIASIKCDGLSVRLIYKDTDLISANTRGNGYEGGDITEHIKYFLNVPMKIAKSGTYIIDGEAIIYDNDFKIINKNNQFKNSRNTASGSLALLDMNIVKQRRLSFIAWDIIQGGCSTEGYYYNMEEAENLGFTTVPMLILDATKVEQKEIANINQTLLKKSKEKGIPCDGVVWRINDTKEGNRRGQTAHHFLNAVAWKPNDEIYETNLKNIEWTMGRTGVLTPVAIFDPIDIDGSTVERASLHNVSVMHETLGNCAYIGESLQVAKMNMIIPQIIEAGPKYDYEEIITLKKTPANCVIEKCPYCGHPVTYKKSEGNVINAYCENKLCESRLVNKLDHFCGKKGLDIIGLSKATLGKFIEWGWVENIEDLYNIETKYRKDFIAKPGFGIKSVTKILNAIEESKHTTLDAFISAIGIPLIGRAVAKDLTNYFETYDDFRNAVNDKNYHFYDLDNFGEEMDNSIKNFNYAEADRISKLLIFETPVVNNIQINNSLTGKTIVITGKLTTFKNRAELKAVIESHGGKVSDSISGKTDLLINNDVNSTSSKNKAAKARNIPIVSELDFMKQYIEN